MILVRLEGNLRCVNQKAIEMRFLICLGVEFRMPALHPME
jgi:hypothetical protein